MFIRVPLVGPSEDVYPGPALLRPLRWLACSLRSYLHALLHDLRRVLLDHLHALLHELGRLRVLHDLGRLRLLHGLRRLRVLQAGSAGLAS